MTFTNNAKPNNMAYEQKPNSGAFFPNARKTADNHPDFTGNFKDASGKLWDVAVWKKSSAKGEFFSFSVKEPYQKP